VTETQEPHKLIRRLHDQRDRHRARSAIYRLFFAGAGLIVLVAGVAMLVLPGPALAVIPIGLFMLAMEFAWAERMLELSIAQAERAKEKAANTTRTQRILSGIATALAAAAAIAASIVWDIPVVPV
jgi:uncharacterized protein (TIGR02611 family)